MTITMMRIRMMVVVMISAGRRLQVKRVSQFHPRLAAGRNAPRSPPPPYASLDITSCVFHVNGLVCLAEARKYTPSF